MKLKDLSEDKSLNADWEELVGDMHLPRQRKHRSPENLRWFLRNALTLNKKHRNIDRAIEMAKLELERSREAHFGASDIQAQ